jgi:molecular chaperone DnaK
MAKDNKEIGRFDLTDIPPAPRGMPQIEVAFDIDADGILHVSAKDIQSGKEQKIRIEASSGLKEEDVKRMVRDAEEHAEEDKKRKEEVDIRNEADSLCFRAEKSLKEYKDRLPAAIVSDVQSKIDNVKKALERNDSAAIKAATEELNTHMQKIGEEMQKAAQSAPHADHGAEHAAPHEQAAPHGQSQNDNIEEAEVEILDDEDNKKH